MVLEYHYTKIEGLGNGTDTEDIRGGFNSHARTDTPGGKARQACEQCLYRRGFQSKLQPFLKGDAASAEVRLRSGGEGPRRRVHTGPGPGDVSLLDIYRAIDGEPSNTGCLFGRGKHCSLKTCLFAALIRDSEELVEKHLGSVTLADYIALNIALEEK